jgi:hypothetical protein
MGIQTAYANARVNGQSSSDKATLQSITDTLLTANYTIDGLPFVLTTGLSLNLPTGKERLNNTELRATIGDGNDLFEVVTFGEGFNAGLNVSLMKQFDKVMAGINSLYVYKTQYDPTAEIEDDTLDPGDQITIAALAIWQISDAWMLTTLGTYSYFWEDRVNGRKEFREGDTVTVGGGLNYNGERLGISLSGQGVFPQKDDVFIEGKLQEEADNSANRTIAGVLDVTYALSPPITLELFGDIRHYPESPQVNSQNGLPSAAKRTRYSVGPGIRLNLNEAMSCSLLAKYVFVERGRDIYVDIEKIYEGLDVKASAVMTF